MSDEIVKHWKQNGSLYLWRYLENTRNYPGWHLSANNLFCESFTDLFKKMLSAKWSSQKLLLITPPNEKILRVPNNHGGKARWYSAKSLLLNYPKNKVDDDYFSLEEIEGKITIYVGTRKLELLNDCISNISKGKGDYSIESDDSQLWFWWN